MYLIEPRLVRVVLCRTLCVNGQVHDEGARVRVPLDIAETLLARGWVRLWPFALG